MAEVLDAPPFTDPNKAREAGLRSAELRKQQATENETLRALLSTKPITDFQPTKPVNEEVNRQIDLCNEQIARTRERLNDDKAHWCEHCERGGVDDKARAALLRELRGLMEHLCRLHNIAQAPTSKVTQTKQRRPEPMPEPTLPCGPGPTISSVPKQNSEQQTPQS